MESFDTVAMNGSIVPATQEWMNELINIEH